MALSVRSFSAVVFCLSAAAAFAQTPKSTDPAPIVQPGAPGQASKQLTPAAVKTTRKPTDPDVEFMQGMIMHHQQAVDMVDLLLKNGKNERLRAFGIKISMSQTDEIKFMKQWLIDRGQALEMSHATMMNMTGMKMLDDGEMVMMGMLTRAQMADLGKAKGTACDRLFLTGMIQHHTGALSMVADLMNSAGGAQDPVLYDFATDVDNTQSAEIKLMKSMLEEIK
jgi:uncharacterized protein (DUF305 family)